MKTITKKHILIVEMEILQNEVHPEHLQTNLRVLNEMTYEAYHNIIEDHNITQKIKQLLMDELAKKAEKDGSTH